MCSYCVYHCSSSDVKAPPASPHHIMSSYLSHFTLCSLDSHRCVLLSTSSSPLAEKVKKSLRTENASYRRMYTPAEYPSHFLRDASQGGEISHFLQGGSKAKAKTKEAKEAKAPHPEAPHTLSRFGAHSNSTTTVALTVYKGKSKSQSCIPSHRNKRPSK